MPIWLTEYGYQTDPPDPTIVGQPWSRQAAYINEADHIAYRNRRVRSVAQFLLVDDQPNRDVPPSSSATGAAPSSRAWSPSAGSASPPSSATSASIDAYPKRVRRGRAVRVYGQLRPAANGSLIRASLQFRRTGSRRWRTIRRVSIEQPAQHRPPARPDPPLGPLPLRVARGHRAATPPARRPCGCVGAAGASAARARAGGGPAAVGERPGRVRRTSEEPLPVDRTRADRARAAPRRASSAS